MKSNLEFPDFISADEAPETEIPDAFSKFLESATLAGTISGPHAHRLVHNLAVEAAERDAPITKHYRKLAADAAKTNPPAPASSILAKNAKRKIVYGRADDTRKVLRTETTKYPLTRTALIAEIAETGGVVRIWEESE